VKPFLHQVKFVKSITDVRDKPALNLPEIAFAGRSNVGKSALLNAVFNIKKLAKVSSTPGKTQLINYFQAAEYYYFVDLPGYGYAKVSKNISRAWQKMIENYIIYSKNLKFVCLLIDSRHHLMKSDEQMADWLNFNKIPYMIILTKCDKLSRNKMSQQQKNYELRFPDHHVIPFSIHSNSLIENFTGRIEDMM
jgi:GTP-binding protein